MVEFAENLDGVVDFKQHLQKLLEDVAKAQSIEDACQLFDQFLSRLNCQLLSVKFYDSENEMDPIRPFSAYSPGMRQFRGSDTNKEGCPFNREAKIRLRPFALSSIDRSKYKELKDRQFFKELEKSGHANIAVLPVVLGRGVSLITIGLYDQPFEGRLRISTSDATSHIVAAVVARFPQVSKLFEKKVLTQTERQILVLACSGLSEIEIGEQLDFSASTILKFKDNIRRKLAASSEAEMIFRALSRGEVFSGFSSGLVFED